MNPPNNFSNTSPKRLWIWIAIIAAIVIIVLGGYFYWQRGRNNTDSTTPTPSPSEVTSQSINDELSGLETDLKSLDDSFNQLDKIDASEDNAISL